MIKQGYVDALLTIEPDGTGDVSLSFIGMDGFTSVGATKFGLNRAETMAVIAALTEALARPEPHGVTIRISPRAVQCVIEEIDE